MKTITRPKFIVPINPSRKFIDQKSLEFSTSKLTPEFLETWTASLNTHKCFDVKTTCDRVYEACQQASNKTQWDKLLYEYCGGLSDPSKMPCFGWSIPAQLCKTGSRLHNISGSTCSDCYALKGRYIFPNVRLAMARRLLTYKLSGGAIHNTFSLVLSSFLNWTLQNPMNGIDSNYFRWFDSGDLQNFGMLCRIVDIARDCPDIKFWLPTRESGLVLSLADRPDNLIIRYSTPMINALSRVPDSTMVFSDDSHVPDNCSICPATTNKADHTCEGNNCRSCWISGHIAYQVH